MSLKRAHSGSFSGQLRCDVCGRPAAWRTRTITACCVYGEALCDRCENKRVYLRRSEENLWVELWGDLRDVISSLRGKLGSLPGRLSKQDPKVPQVLAPIIRMADD